MTLYFYPPDLRQQFVDRERELQQLDHYLDQLRAGRPIHIALLGLRRIGKTLLFKEFMARLLAKGDDVIPIYVDLSESCASPEQFATAYIGLVAYWLLTRGQALPLPYFDPHTLYAQVAGAGEPIIEETVRRLNQELDKAKPNRHVLLELAFSLPVRLAHEKAMRFVVILDEFQEIRTLENFIDTRNVVAIFRANLQHQSGVAYFLAGSAITALSGMIADYRSPLFVQLVQVPLGGFDRDGTAALVARWLPDAVRDPFLTEEIYALTQGHPFYVTALCQRMHTFHETADRPLTPQLAREAFVIETLSHTGTIYELCRYVHDVALHRATGYASLKAVLHTLAIEEGLTASAVGRRLKVTPGTARNYLRWLVEVDLTVERDKRYYFRDPVLRYWVAMVTRGIEAIPTTLPVDLMALIEELDLLYQRTTSELGLAKESQVRELLRAFAGQTVDGALFGLSGKITLPTFTRVEPYIAPDNAYELDALAEACPEAGRRACVEAGRSSDERWAVEVKWRNRRADYNDLAGFHAKALDLDARPWFIAKTGLTSSAQTCAREKNILVSTERELQALAERLGVRFAK
jgi:AAA+ ATPase superfamily predicted ATPase